MARRGLLEQLAETFADFDRGLGQGIANRHIVHRADKGKAAVAVGEPRAQLLDLAGAFRQGRDRRGAGDRENNLTHRIFGSRGRLAALLGEFGANLFLARLDALVQGLHQDIKSKVGAEMSFEVVWRHPGVLKCLDQGLRGEFHLLRDLDDLMRNVAVFRVDAKFAVLIDFKALRKEAFDRGVARRRFAQNAKHLYPLVDIDVCNRIAVDAGDDFLGEGGDVDERYESGDRGNG